VRGVCIIGMQNVSMIPLISFDAVVNIYLTILFLIPLKSKVSFLSLNIIFKQISSQLHTH
jgi:hypothetical protein